MTAVEASSFPSFQRRGRPRSGRVVSKKSRSLLICSRSAPYFCWNLLTTPSAPLRNGNFLLMAQPPSFKRRGMGPSLATNPIPPRRNLYRASVVTIPPARTRPLSLVPALHGAIRPMPSGPASPSGSALARCARVERADSEEWSGWSRGTHR